MREDRVGRVVLGEDPALAEDRDAVARARVRLGERPAAQNPVALEDVRGHAVDVGRALPVAQLALEQIVQRTVDRPRGVARIDVERSDVRELDGRLIDLIGDGGADDIEAAIALRRRIGGVIGLFLGDRGTDLAPLIDQESERLTRRRRRHFTADEYRKLHRTARKRATEFDGQELLTRQGWHRMYLLFLSQDAVESLYHLHGFLQTQGPQSRSQLASLLRLFRLILEVLRRVLFQLPYLFLSNMLLFVFELAHRDSPCPA